MAYLGRPGATAPLTSADIPDNSITAAKIVESTIAAGDLAPNSVDSSELVDGGVDLSHMSANSVDSDQYVDGSIDTAHIGDDQVTGDKLANDIAISTSGAITTTGAFTSVGIDDNASGATAITIDANEKVGIGDTAPPNLLTVKGDNTNSGNGDNYGQFVIQGATNENARLNFGIDTDASPIYGWITAGENTVAYRKLILNGGGGVVQVGGSISNGAIGFDSSSVTMGAKASLGGKRIGYLSNKLWIDSGGSDSIHLEGWGTGTVSVNSSDIMYISSDGRMKNEAGEIEDGLSMVNGLLPRYFFWKEYPDAPKDLGFFSQEVNSVCPEAGTKKAKKDQDGNPVLDEEGNPDYHWGILDRALIAVLVKAVQELSTKVTALENA